LLIEQKGDLDDATEEKSDLESANKDLHGQCDFVLNNFDTRQQARSEEIEALREAMGILSGALN